VREKYCSLVKKVRLISQANRTLIDALRFCRQQASTSSLVLTHVFVNDNTCNSGGLHVSRPPNARDYIFLGRNFIYVFSGARVGDDMMHGNVHMKVRHACIYAS